MKFIRRNYWKTIFYKVPLSPLTKERINTVFSLMDRKTASHLLSKKCGITLPKMASVEAEDFERIRFAAIKLSNGKLVELERLIDEAHVNCHGLVERAGFGEDPKAHLDWLP